MLLENEFIQFSFDEKGRPIKLTERSTGRNYCVDRKTPLFMIKQGEKIHKPDLCSYREGKIKVEFKAAGVEAVIAVTDKRKYLVFEVTSVSGGDPDEFTFLNLKVNLTKYVSRMSGVASDGKFAFCLRQLNLQVAPTLPPVLQSTCYKKYGFEGARAALVGCPFDQLRAILKDLVREECLISSPLGGPFALDAEINRYAYAFTSDISESNVDKWIETVKKGGIKIILFCNWHKSPGTYEIHTDSFPNGLAGMKNVVHKIHRAGLKAGMHCMTGFITPEDPLVTPIPDKRIAKDKTFTLSSAIGEREQIVPVLENPQGLDTIWAGNGHGNIVQIDNELIQYSGLSEDPPYALTGCARGAFGTKVSSHPKGASAHHLYSFYSAFYPDPDSSLVDEIARNITHVFNECDFDMIYMDGSEGMPRRWYGVSKMRAAIFSRIKKPIRVEASQWSYHAWPYHSCIGAWDGALSAFKQFIDDHCRHNEEWRTASLMNAQLGWWPIYAGALPDEMEYLACKSLAFDFPMSFTGISAENPANARQDEYLEIVGRYERLRLERYFPETTLKILKKPGNDFHLVQAKDGDWQFLPTDYIKHKVTGLEDDSNVWLVMNRFSNQPARFRIQALSGVGSYEGGGLVLTDFREEKEFESRIAGSKPCRLNPSSKEIKIGKMSGCYSAKSNQRSRKGAWSQVSKLFSPEINISKFGALGVWVCGDGNGELLNLQLNHPAHYFFMFDEHYILIDFKGWRYFELPLCERDSEAFWKYKWPYKKIAAELAAAAADDYCHILNIQDVMSICGFHLQKEHVHMLSIYYNNLPSGKEVRCYLGPIKALPVAKIRMTNPAMEIAGKRIVFPVTLESRQYLEFNSLSDCKLYDERSALIREIKPQGEAPVLATGNNKVVFLCEGTPGYRSRLQATVISSGKPIQTNH